MHSLCHWKRHNVRERIKVLNIIIMMKSDKMLTILITMAQKFEHKSDDIKIQVTNKRIMKSIKILHMAHH